MADMSATLPSSTELQLIIRHGTWSLTWMIHGVCSPEGVVHCLHNYFQDNLKSLYPEQHTLCVGLLLKSKKIYASISYVCYNRCTGYRNLWKKKIPHLIWIWCRVNTNFLHRNDLGSLYRQISIVNGRDQWMELALHILIHDLFGKLFFRVNYILIVVCSMSNNSGYLQFCC